VWERLVLCFLFSVCSVRSVGRSPWDEQLREVLPEYGARGQASGYSEIHG